MGTPLKVHLLLARAVNANHVDFAGALQREASRDLGVSVWVALPVEVMGASPQGASGAGLRNFDAILEIRLDAGSSNQPPVNALVGIGARVRSVIDPARSAVLAGTEHLIMPGAAPVCLFCLLRRVEWFNREEFQRYWLDVHAEFGRRPGNRYRQIHTDTAATAEAARHCGIPATDFDGVATAYFDDVGQLRAVLASPAIAGDAFVDEQRFIAHVRSLFLPFAMQEDPT